MVGDLYYFIVLYDMDEDGTTSSLRRPCWSPHNLLGGVYGAVVAGVNPAGSVEQEKNKQAKAKRHVHY